MSLKVGIGFSDGSDAHAVGVNACQEAFRKMAGETPIFGLVFVSSGYEHEKAIEGIQSVLKGVPLLGSSSADGIICEGINIKKSIVVVLLSGKDIFFSSSVKELDTEAQGETIESICERIIRELGGKPDLTLMFTDILSKFPQHRLVRDIQKLTGSMVFGGASADSFQFKKTFQYFKNSVRSGSAVFGSIKGSFKFGLGMDHGMLPVGMPRTITKSEGVHLYHINDKPAITMYGEYFGYKDLQGFIAEPIAKMATSYPLGFRWEIGESHINIRAPLYLESDGSFICNDSVPEGASVQIMIGDKGEAQKSVQRASHKAMSMLGENEVASLAVMISGAGRKYLYGNNIDDEVKEVKRIVGHSVPVVGFYSYGNICAPDFSISDSDLFQDNSVSVCLLK